MSKAARIRPQPAQLQAPSAPPPVIPLRARRGGGLQVATATSLDAQGKRNEADQLYRRALAVFVRLFGREHYDVAVNLNNLAALYQATGDIGKAERLYRRALIIKEKILKANHPDIALTLNNLAVLYKSQGRFNEAEPLYSRALAIFKESLADTHPHVTSCQANYARLLKSIRQRPIEPPNPI